MHINFFFINRVIKIIFMDLLYKFNQCTRVHIYLY